ncbi:hypothetical protein BLOT_012154 [Blomia tropicalis]|nr:hypothetical protein BLOT_012154 [Blomia tropicalis]
MNGFVIHCDDSFFLNKKYRSYPICEYIRYVALSALTFLQIFIIAIAKISRLKLKIHNYNVAFHTKKKYGITYASFGLITMSSFFKISND